MPQRGWKPADTTVFRIAEAPPVAYFSQQFFLFVSDGILFVNSGKKYAKNATETDGFWTSFPLKSCVRYGP